VRNVPDVAAEANTDNYFCANGRCQGGVGGTSLAGSALGRVPGSRQRAGQQSSTGMRLDDWLSGTGSGNQIDIWPSNDTGAQSWVFSNVSVAPGGFFNLAVSYGPFCVQSTGTTSGSVVNLQPCNGSASQSWSIN
jgi:hypothetical protein